MKNQQTHQSETISRKNKKSKWWKTFVTTGLVLGIIATSFVLI